MKPGDFDLSARLYGRRAVPLIGPIDEVSAPRACMMLLYLHSVDASRPIRLVVDSPGGSVDEALKVFDVMRHVGTVSTHCASKAEGVAALLVAAGVRGSRTSEPTGQFRLVECDRDPTTAAPETQSAEESALEVSRANGMIRKLLVESTGQDVEVIAERMRARRLMPAAEAIALGIVDRSIEGSWLK